MSNLAAFEGVCALAVNFKEETGWKNEITVYDLTRIRGRRGKFCFQLHYRNFRTHICATSFYFKPLCHFRLLKLKLPFNFNLPVIFRIYCNKVNLFKGILLCYFSSFIQLDLTLFAFHFVF